MYKGDASYCSHLEKCYRRADEHLNLVKWLHALAWYWRNLNLEINFEFAKIHAIKKSHENSPLLSQLISNIGLVLQ